MNPAIIFKTAQIIFRLRKLIALAVLIEFAAKKRLNGSGHKKKKSSDTDLQAFADDMVGRAQVLLKDFKKRTSK